MARTDMHMKRNDFIMQTTTELSSIDLYRKQMGRTTLTNA